MDTAFAPCASAGPFAGTGPGAGAVCAFVKAAVTLNTKGRLSLMNTEHGAALRTQAQAVADVRYGIAYGALNERFWQKLDTTLNLAQILAGALALSGAFAQAPTVAGVAGTVVAVVSAFQLALQPTRKSIDFRDARRRFHELNARAWQMPLHELDAELEQLRMSAPNGLAALARPALFQVDAQHGSPRHERLNWRERLAMALA